MTKKINGLSFRMFAVVATMGNVGNDMSMMRSRAQEVCR